MFVETKAKMKMSFLCLGLAVVYFLAAKWGLTLAFVQANATAVWPPTGIALAALLMGGWRFWPGIFLGAFTANLMTNGTVVTSLGIAVGNTLEALVGFYLVNRFAGGKEALHRTADLFKFAILGGLVAPIVSATVGVGTLALAGLIGSTRFQDVWLTWWLGDMGGALLVAPPILLRPPYPFPRIKPLKFLEGACLATLLFLSAWILFRGQLPLSTENYPVHFLFFPLLLWAAFRFGPFASSLAVLSLSLFAIQGTLHGWGPFHGPTENQSLLFLQGYMSVTAITILALASGIEERRKAEEELRWSHSDLQLRILERTEDLQKANLSLGREVEEKRRLSLLVETSSDFICLAAVDGHMLYVNKEGRRLVGLKSQEDTSAKLHKEFIAPADVPRLMNEVIASLLYKGHWAGEFMLRHFKTGEALPFHFTAVLIKDPITGEPKAMAGIGRDLREMKKKDEELRRMALVVENIQDYAIYFLEPRGKVMTWNNGAQRIKGYKASEAIGMDFSRFFSPEDVASGKPENLLRQAEEWGRAEDEGWRVRKDGSRFWADSIMTALRDEKGELQGFAKITRDVTHRKRMEELNRSNQELEQFAYVASHDLQEPLRMVTSFVQLLARKYQGRLDEEADQYIHETVEGVNRMRTLILDLLAYSRVDSAEAPFVQVDCAVALGQALTNLGTALKENHAEVINGELPSVWGDSNQIVQLFQNLVGNAVKFHGPIPPKIQVEAERIGGEWIFCIKDNGIGIDPKYFNQIFEVFKRLHTRSEYPGTGIGLAICKKVVARHGGRIWVESEPGKGAAFYWSMPLLKEARLETGSVT